jgi:thiol-disulfide isomerase/thioredoxin
MKIKKLAGGLLALAMGVILGRAADTDTSTLGVGHAAPKLQVSKWVQGEAVKDFERDKAYIVEFWATWCGPCVASIPHVNELHTKFKDKGLVVIGQNVWENDTSKVEPFIKKMGEKMTYRVALDTGEGNKGKMAETWMRAAAQNGIPAAFVVNKEGKIAWIGHPMTLKENLLEEVLDGRFDVAKAAAAYEKKKKQEKEEQSIWQEFNKRVKAKEWDEADAALTKLENMRSEEDRDQLGLRRFQLLLDRQDYKGAYKLAARLSDSHPEDKMLQNELAWKIATGRGIAERDLDLAEKIARRANETAKGKDAEILDTLARVLFLKGEKEAAIEYQTKAVEFAAGSRKEQFEGALESYKKGEQPKGY